MKEAGNLCNSFDTYNTYEECDDLWIDLATDENRQALIKLGQDYIRESEKALNGLQPARGTL